MTIPGILWRRLDHPGHEAARLERRDGIWELRGTAVFEHERQPCRLNYRVVCDDAWRSVTGKVKGWVGERDVAVEIAVEEGRWMLNGVEVPEVAGCTDLDLNFSPSTNLLPIRRLRLAPGGQAGVKAAWLRFPGFHLEPLEQVYSRTGEETYRYKSAGGTFMRDLTVDENGFVTLYPGLWQAEGR